MAQKNFGILKSPVRGICLESFIFLSVSVLISLTGYVPRRWVRDYFEIHIIISVLSEIFLHFPYMTENKEEKIDYA